MITEIIYLGRDNESELIVLENNATPDFSGVTRMVLKFDGSQVVVDSATNPELISWTSDGRVSLHLGALDIEPSRYMSTLITYDPLHDDGQVIFHAAEGRVQFWFVPE